MGSTNAWEVQIRKTGFPTCSRTFDSKAEGRAWATRIVSEMERGDFRDRTGAEKTTFGTIIKLYMVEVSPSKRGASGERYRLGAILRDDPIALLKMSALTNKLSAAWCDKRLQNVLSSSTNRDLSLMSAVINWARREQGIYIENPIGSGLQDIFIACLDGLKGFPDAIEAVFPKTTVQLCFVPMVRHSLNYVSWKRRPNVAADPRLIYQSATAEVAELRLGEFEEKWDAEYLPIGQSWQRNWPRLIPGFASATSAECFRVL